MRVLVTGASGLLGLNLCLTQARDHQIVGVAHRSRLADLPFGLIKADLSEDGAVQSVIAETKPELVINCAAMADVDQCEQEPQAAERINAWMPGQTAAYCAERGISFVHISTDAVFDGATGGYRETDSTNPLSVYARSKLDGEARVLANHPSALVARVNFYGHSLSGKRSLAEFFLYNLLENHPVRGFTDVIFSPLYVKHLVTILFEMAEKKLSGLFHVVAAEKISKYNFGRIIAEKMSLDQNLISPVSVHDAGLQAKRSPNLDLDTTKLQKTGIQLPALDLGVAAFADDYNSDWPEKLRGYLDG